MDTFKDVTMSSNGAMNGIKTTSGARQLINNIKKSINTAQIVIGEVQKKLGEALKQAKHNMQKAIDKTK
jgi:hypothetical protein